MTTLIIAPRLPVKLYPTIRPNEIFESYPVLQPGLSAYEIAVQNGYQGTEQEFAAQFNVAKLKAFAVAMAVAI